MSIDDRIINLQVTARQLEQLKNSLGTRIHKYKGLIERLSPDHLHLPQICQDMEEHMELFRYLRRRSMNEPNLEESQDLWHLEVVADQVFNDYWEAYRGGWDPEVAVGFGLLLRLVEAELQKQLPGADEELRK